MAPPPAPETLPQPASNSAIADGLLDYSVGVVPLAEAWVLIVPSYGNVREPWLFKTDSTGELQLIDPSTFAVRDHYDVHAINSSQAFAHDRTLTYAWCQNLTVFQWLVQDYVNDPTSWKLKWPTATMYFDMPDPWPLLGLVDQEAFPDLNEQERMRLALILHNQGPHGDRFFQTEPGQFEIEGVKPGVTFFFARRPAISAMYLAEVITRYATSLSRRSAEAYLTFATALTLNDRLIAPYQALLKKRAAKTLTIQERYLIWAHDCGVAHVPITAFQNSLPIFTNPNWEPSRAALLAPFQSLLNLHPELKPPIFYPDPDGPHIVPTDDDPYLYYYDTDGSVFQSYAQWRVFAEIEQYGDTPQFILAATRATANAVEVVRRIAADAVLEKSSLLQQFIPEAVTQMGNWENFHPLCTRWMGAHLDVKRIWLEAISPPSDPNEPKDDSEPKDDGESVAKKVASFIEKIGTAEYYYDLVTSFFDTKAAYIARLMAEVPGRFPDLLASAKTLQDELVIHHFLNISNIHLKVDTDKSLLLVSGLGLGKEPVLGSFKLVDVDGHPVIDLKAKAHLGSLYEGKPRKVLQNLGFSSPLTGTSVPAALGAVGSIAKLISDLMNFSELYKENGVIAYFEVAKDTGYAVESIAECTEVVLSMVARSRLATLRTVVDAAVEDAKPVVARIAQAELLVGKRMANQTAKAQVLSKLPRSASKAAKLGATEASNTAKVQLQAAKDGLARAQAQLDKIESGLPSDQGRELFTASLKGTSAAEAEESGVFDQLAEFAGETALHVGMATLPLEMLLTFREGAILFFQGENDGDVVIGGADMIGAGTVAVLIATMGLSAAFAPATLVLAGVAFIELGVDAYEALFGTPNDELPMEKALSDAKAQEIKEGRYHETWNAHSKALGLPANTPFVCNTQAGLLSLAAGLAKVLAL